MADPNPTSLLAQPFTMPSSVAITVTDTTGAGPPVTRTSGVAGVAAFTSGKIHRVYLASVGSGTGTAANPYEWLTYLQDRINNGTPGVGLWAVTLNTSGLVQIQYTGNGTGTITWDGTGATSVIPRYLTGFNANISLTNGQTATATYQPTHCWFSIAARAASHGWQMRNKRSALGQPDDGTQYAFTASKALRTYTSDWRFHPYDLTESTALSCKGTQYQPVIASRWTAPSATPSTTNSPPWSIVDFLGSVHGARCGVALGTLQTLIAGSSSAFYDVTVDESTLHAEDNIVPSAPDWSQRVDVKGVKLRYVATSTRV